MASGFKIKPIHIIVIGLAIVLGSAMGYYTIPGLTPVPVEPPTTPVTPPSQLPPPGGKAAAQIQWTGINEITRASLTTPDVEIALATNGVFDFMNANDQVAANSAPEQSTAYFAENAQLIIHIEDDADPTGGEDYYDRWYYVTLAENQPIYRIGATNLAAVQSSPTYKYQVVSNGIDTGERVHWTSGTTNYWDIGKLAIVPRTDDASLDQYMKWAGTTMSSMTDGISEDDTQAEQNSDVTLTTDVEDFVISFICDTTNLGWAVEQYTISSIGQFQARPTVLIISTNATAVSVDRLQSYGWTKMDKTGLTAEVAFYKVLSEQIPINGQKFTYDVAVPFDVSAAAASTAYNLIMWAVDVQLVANVAVGAPSTTIPTAYGMIAGYGIAAIINDEVQVVGGTVAGESWDTATLFGDFTTAA